MSVWRVVVVAIVCGLFGCGQQSADLDGAGQAWTLGEPTEGATTNNASGTNNMSGGTGSTSGPAPVGAARLWRGQEFLGACIEQASYMVVDASEEYVFARPGAALAMVWLDANTCEPQVRGAFVCRGEVTDAPVGQIGVRCEVPEAERAGLPAYVPWRVLRQGTATVSGAAQGDTLTWQLWVERAVGVWQRDLSVSEARRAFDGRDSAEDLKASVTLRSETLAQALWADTLPQRATVAARVEISGTVTRDGETRDVEVVQQLELPVVVESGAVTGEADQTLVRIEYSALGGRSWDEVIIAQGWDREHPDVMFMLAEMLPARQWRLARRRGGSNLVALDLRPSWTRDAGSPCDVYASFWVQINCPCVQ